MLQFDLLAQIDVEGIDETVAGAVVAQFHVGALADQVEHLAIDQFARELVLVVLIEGYLDFDRLGHLALLVDAATLVAVLPLHVLLVEVVEHAKEAHAMERIIAVAEVLVETGSHVLASFVGSGESAPDVVLVFVFSAKDGAVGATQQLGDGGLALGRSLVRAVVVSQRLL